MKTWDELGIDIRGKVAGEVKTVARFFAKICATDTCWFWTGARFSNGYGVFALHGKNIRAHRYMYQLINGPILESLLVLHHCDIRHCVHPDHLFMGTQADNMQDMVAKGRQRIVVNIDARCKPREKYVSNTSGHVGVYWMEHIGKWAARIQIRGKPLHLGVFASYEEAVEARKGAEQHANMG